MPSIDDLPPPNFAKSAGIDDLPPPPQMAKAAESAPKMGPEPDNAWDRFKERIQDPQRWKAVLNNSGPYANKDLVQGDVPMVMPASALGTVGKGLVALGEGKGLAYAAGRTALSGSQGYAMSKFNGADHEDAKASGELAAGIQAAAESIPYVGKFAGMGARKLGQALTGVAPDLIENFAKRTDQVNELIKRSGGNITEMADQIRSELSGGIQKAKTGLNNQISSAIDKASPEANISAKSIIDKLEASKAKLNPNFKSNAINDIDEMIANIRAQAGESGNLTAKGLYETKQYLGSEAKGAYQKGGTIFQRANEASRAAKEAAAEARGLVKTHIPDISAADAQLAKMHAIESRLNKNLLAPGTSDSALMAVGSGANPRNAANLRALEEISGVNATQRAKDLATAREFASPSLLPTDFTGKAMARMAVGAGVGGFYDGKEGALIGGALTSPMALKGVINAANVAGKVARVTGIPQVAQAIRQNPAASQAVAQMTATQLRRANTNNPMTGPQEDQAPGRLMQNSREQNRTPAVGEMKWAMQGIAKLGIQDAFAERLLADPKARQLLVQASDLSPGSKASQRIMNQIQKGWGNQ